MPNNLDWSALYLWREGPVVAENAARCCATMEALSRALVTDGAMERPAPRRAGSRSGLPRGLELLDAIRRPAPERLIEPEVVRHLGGAEHVGNLLPLRFVRGAPIDDAADQLSAGAIARVEDECGFARVLGEGSGRTAAHQFFRRVHVEIRDAGREAQHAGTRRGNDFVAAAAEGVGQRALHVRRRVAGDAIDVFPRQAAESGMRIGEIPVPIRPELDLRRIDHDLAIAGEIDAGPQVKLIEKPGANGYEPVGARRDSRLHAACACYAEDCHRKDDE